MVANIIAALLTTMLVEVMTQFLAMSLNEVSSEAWWRRQATPNYTVI